MNIELSNGILSRIHKVAPGLYKAFIENNREIKISVPDISKLKKRESSVVLSKLNRFITLNFDADTLPSVVISIDLIRYKEKIQPVECLFDEKIKNLAIDFREKSVMDGGGILIGKLFEKDISLSRPFFNDYFLKKFWEANIPILGVFYTFKYEVSESEIDSYKGYMLDEIVDVDDFIIADKYSDNNVSVIRVKNDNPRVSVLDEKSGVQDKIVLFDFGEGNDRAVGYKERNNAFMVGQGHKQFTGGNQSDTFIINKDDAEGHCMLDGGNGSDTLVLAAISGESGNNFASLDEGKYYHYDIKEKLKTTVAFSHIENLIGHEKMADLLVGDRQDNYLNGLGGVDTIFGMQGNDVIALQAGRAYGGTGNDSYHILQNNSDKTVTITINEIPEESLKPEVSNIILDYGVEQIVSVRRSGNTMLFELRNNNDSVTELVLSDCYRPVEGQWRRVLDYNFITHDGFILTPQWPTELQTSTEWFHPVLLAQYSLLNDNGYHALLAHHGLQDITVRFDLTAKNGHSLTHLIKQLSGEEIILRQKVLPPVVRLAFHDMPVLMGYLPNYELLGDENSNVFLAQQGEGLLQGRGGSDHYLVQHNPAKPMEIVIDNYDREEAIDILSFEGVQAYEFVAISDGEDVILTHRQKPAEYSRVRLVNYLQDESYRHLVLTDSSNPLIYEDITPTGMQIYQIEIVNTGKPVIVAQIIPLATDNIDFNDPLAQLSELMASIPIAERAAASDNYYQGQKNIGLYFTVNSDLSAA
ncbi:putative virulence determinant [Yersinia mollaretii]|uniref:calcium-binding protein n=1 Tax=Yersinia mollaretii TaxID=33060 RepID=UPI0005E5A7CF|nr:calcium-binding protein [Yersinia mollaretii]CNJ79751.1 putative virulence determinant [Yersinia mollaretii]